MPAILIADDAVDCCMTDDKVGPINPHHGHADGEWDDKDVGSLVDFNDYAEATETSHQGGAQPEFKDILDEDSDDSSVHGSVHTTDDGIGEDELQAMDIDDTTDAETSIKNESDLDEFES